MKLPGVLSCGVPGAGGHDAIVAIALGNNALMRIENHWLNMKDKRWEQCLHDAAKCWDHV